MFPFLSGMLSGLLGSGAGGAAASGLGGMALGGMSGGPTGNLAGIGEMASAGGQTVPAPANGREMGGNGVQMVEGEFLTNPFKSNASNGQGTPQSGSPGGMGQAPTQGQSPLMQLPTMNGQDPLMSSNSLLNGIGGPMKQFFGMGG